MEEWQQCRSSLCIYRSALPQKTVLPRAKVGRPEDLTERTGNSRLGPREGYKNGKVIHPLRFARRPCLRGTKERKTEGCESRLDEPKVDDKSSQIGKLIFPSPKKVCG